MYKWAVKLLAGAQKLVAVLEAITLQTQVGRWRRVASAGRPAWDSRNKTIAGFVPSGSSVLDLGCGAQTLRKYLPPGCVYQPCDLVKSTPDVILCDFNAGIYPKLRKKFTHVVCSGVLEYVRDHDRFLTECISLGEVVILSYNPRLPRTSKLQRMANHWINHFSRRELESTFEANGCAVECLYTTESGEVIYRLTSVRLD